MSPTKFITITVLACVATVTKILCTIFELTTPGHVMPEELAVLCNLFVTATWCGVFTGYLLTRIDTRAGDTAEQTVAQVSQTIETIAAGCVDNLKTRIDEAVADVKDRIDQAVDEAGDRRAIAAAAAAINEARKWHPHPEPRRPHLVEN